MSPGSSAVPAVPPEVARKRYVENVRLLFSKGTPRAKAWATRELQRLTTDPDYMPLLRLDSEAA